MSVSLYYSVTGSAPLDTAKRRALEEIAVEANSRAPADTESIWLQGEGDEPVSRLSGSSSPAAADVAGMVDGLRHLLDALSRMHRVLPEADWEVCLGEQPVPWDENSGYSLPGLDDPALGAEEPEAAAERQNPQFPEPRPRRRWWGGRS